MMLHLSTSKESKKQLLLQKCLY